jgi:hypothetical protein
MNAPTPQSQPDNSELRQHTPTPWRVEVDRHFGPGFVITAEGMGNRCPVLRMSSPLGEADETLRGDAELIVEAVNSHAALKSRVEELTKLVRSAYNEGFREGIRETLTSRGGLVWGESKAAKALAMPLEGRGGAT